MPAQENMHATEQLRATIANPGLFSESPTFPGLIEDCCVMEGLFSHQGNQCRLPSICVHDRRTGREMTTVEQL